MEKTVSGAATAIHSSHLGGGSPQGVGMGSPMAVIQPYETAAIAAREGITRKYDPRAVLVGVREVPDPRGQVEEAPAYGFYARDAETGEWEQI